MDGCRGRAEVARLEGADPGEGRDIPGGTWADGGFCTHPRQETGCCSGGVALNSHSVSGSLVFLREIVVSGFALRPDWGLSGTKRPARGMLFTGNHEFSHLNWDTPSTSLRSRPQGGYGPLQPGGADNGHRCPGCRGSVRNPPRRPSCSAHGAPRAAAAVWRVTITDPSPSAAEHPLPVQSRGLCWRVSSWPPVHRECHRRDGGCWRHQGGSAKMILKDPNKRLGTLGHPKSSSQYPVSSRNWTNTKWSVPTNKPPSF